MDLVVIIFKLQKNDTRDRIVHMFQTDDGIMCPVVGNVHVVLSEIKIQRIGTWESFIFIYYFRLQVENFTHGV